MYSTNGGHKTRQEAKEAREEQQKIMADADPQSYWMYQMIDKEKSHQLIQRILFWLFVYIFLFAGEPDIMDGIRNLVLSLGGK